jgi:hypothetical protein
MQKSFSQLNTAKVTCVTKDQTNRMDSAGHHDPPQDPQVDCVEQYSPTGLQDVGALPQPS